MDGLSVILVIWTVCVTAVWLAIGWRAMRAHERLAEAVEAIAERG